jgi:hypothetical protein
LVILGVVVIGSVVLGLVVPGSVGVTKNQWKVILSEIKKRYWPLSNEFLLYVACKTGAPNFSFFENFNKRELVMFRFGSKTAKSKISWKLVKKWQFKV